jgi:hypothetical protein
MIVQRLYTIEPKPDGSGFMLITPDSSTSYGFLTKELALERVRSVLGEDFQHATVTNRKDGGINVYSPQLRETL